MKIIPCLKDFKIASISENGFTIVPDQVQILQILKFGFKSMEFF